MLTIILCTVAYVAGVISCAVWLKVVPQLRGKVEAKVDEYR